MYTGLCTMKDWELLSVSDSGEAVLGYNKNDVFVVTKLRNICNVVGDGKIYSAYIARLKEEAAIMRIDTTVTFDSCGRTWSVRLITLKEQMVSYVLYASSIQNDREYVIESTFLTSIDYLEFMKQFADFAVSIDFQTLEREAGKISDCSISVTAIAISDVMLQPETDNGVLLFIGKNKYFAVIVSESSQKSILKNSISSNCLEFVSTSCNGNGSLTRYRVLDENKNKISGVVELFSKEVSNKFVEVLGYWIQDTEASIEDNILLQINEVSDAK